MTQAGLKLLIFPPLPLKCWDCRYELLVKLYLNLAVTVLYKAIKDDLYMLLIPCSIVLNYIYHGQVLSSGVRWL